MDANEESLLRTTLAEITAKADGAALTADLDQFGWQDLLAAGPSIAIPAVFEGQGVAGTWSSALHDVLGAALELEFDAVVLIPLPGHMLTAERTGSALEVRGLILSARPNATNAVVSLGDPDQTPTLVKVPMSELAIEGVKGLDPTISASLVSGSNLRAKVSGELGDGSQWEDALADGRLALSHHLIGAMGAMEALAVTHALERIQFGRQVGSFQAVRHRLAEVRVAIEAARGASMAAGPMGDRFTDDLSDAQFASLLAKLIAGRSATRVAVHCQQVLAGIGFTSEHPFHRFMKRVTVLEKILGDTAYLSELVGNRLVALQQAPRIIDL